MQRKIELLALTLLFSNLTLKPIVIGIGPFNDYNFDDYKVIADHDTGLFIALVLSWN